MQMVWMVSCFATVMNDVMTGLMISLAFTLISVVLREQWPKMYWLAQATDQETYKPKERYSSLKSFDDNVKVLRFESALHFANVTSFLDTVNELMHSEDDEHSELSSIKQVTTESMDQSNGSEYKQLPLKEISSSVDDETTERSVKVEIANRILIVDCGAVSYIDTMGLDAFKEIYSEGLKHGVDVYFADVSESIIDILENVEFFVTVPKTVFFPTVHQAAVFANKTLE
ncbi:unnamed protein product [Anisakis simplex]|uniref:STAS domain-containing protein n=1 Tax=Anisakis simplex TaxID=6269 RepID=A0A0M3J2G8_ANISI|nr:unnamed protein product [Anisakis simplex]